MPNKVYNIRPAARDRGRRAYQAGMLVSDNPYTHAGWASEWAAGYVSALWKDMESDDNYVIYIDCDLCGCDSGMTLAPNNVRGTTKTYPTMFHCSCCGQSIVNVAYKHNAD